MVGERFGEPRNLNRVKPGKLATRRLELHRRSVCRQITNVRPVEYFDRITRAHEARGGEPSPKTLETNVCSCHSPVSRRFDQLHVIHAYHPFAVDIDQLLIKHIASKQHFAIAAYKRTEI